MKKYKVIIAPASEDKDLFDNNNVTTYKEAEKLCEKELMNCSIEKFKFNTKEEAEAFISGFNAGIGWLGSEAVYKNFE